MNHFAGYDWDRVSRSLSDSANKRLLYKASSDFLDKKRCGNDKGKLIDIAQLVLPSEVDRYIACEDCFQQYKVIAKNTSGKYRMRKNGQFSSESVEDLLKGNNIEYSWKLKVYSENVINLFKKQKKSDKEILEFLKEHISSDTWI